MTLWFILGIMTAAALGAVIWPFARVRTLASAGSDLAVYRDQLEEIERDRADGRIGHDEFEAARVYLRLERYDEAVKARRNALNLLGATAQREVDLGEALAMAAGGVVTADAKAAFERAAALDADNPKAMFYLGLAAQQDGSAEEAAQIWRNLIAKAPANAPWLPVVREQLGRVEKPGAVPPPGPTHHREPR